MPFGPKLLEPISANLSEIKPIPGCDGYFINTAGEVFCIRKLQTYTDRQGYVRVGIRKAGKNYRKGIHWLLAKTFLSKLSKNQREVRHLDGNPSNNNLGNLAWGTRQENAADMAIHGSLKGERNPKAILTPEQVSEIRSAIPYYGYRKHLAQKFGICIGAVTAVRNGRNWKHI